MAVFGPAYVDLFARRCAHLAPRERILAALDTSIAGLLRHDDPDVTNEAYFWEVFPRQSGLPEATLRPCVERFCTVDVPLLRGLTRPASSGTGGCAGGPGAGLEGRVGDQPHVPRGCDPPADCVGRPGCR